MGKVSLFFHEDPEEKLIKDNYYSYPPSSSCVKLYQDRNFKLIECGFRILFQPIVPRVFFKNFTVVFSIYHANSLFGVGGSY